MRSPDHLLPSGVSSEFPQGWRRLERKDGRIFILGHLAFARGQMAQRLGWPREEK